MARSIQPTCRGSTIIEVAILAPLVVLAIVFVAWAGAQRSADAEAMAAARAAARAAAIANHPSDAAGAGERAGAEAANSTACTRITIAVDTGEWDEGWVSATATCTPGNAASALGSGGVITRTWIEAVGERGQAGR